MSTNVLTKAKDSLPTIFDDYFKPWNEWFDGGGLLHRMLTVPAVNITKEENDYKVTLAAPGMKKTDFNVSMDNNILTISAVNENEHEEKKKKYTRREYNYTSFSRSFTLPEDVDKKQINAKYDNGVLTLTMPVNKDKKAEAGKKIKVD